MQGLNYLDLAKNLADGHLEDASGVHHSPNPKTPTGQGRMREWLGHRLIHVGERLAPRPELRLEVSTGPPGS